MPRGQQSRAARHAPSNGVVIPDKLYFRIGEVSELTETKAYVLRYWETEFAALKPVKSRTGHRLYRRQDVETIFEIKRLLYEKGFTIEGARKQLSGNSHQQTDSRPAAASATPLLPLKPSEPSAIDRQELRAIRRELEGILTVLSRKC